MDEFCCEEMQDNIELGYIHHDDKHSILKPKGYTWESGIIFYVDFEPDATYQFKLTFCPFCGKKL